MIRKNSVVFEKTTGINLDAMEPISETSSVKSMMDVRDFVSLSEHEKNKILAMDE